MAYQFGKKIKIETKRLLARSLMPGDVNENYISYWNSPEWRLATGNFGAKMDVQKAINYVSTIDHKRHFHFGIFARDPQKLVGICNMSRDPRQKVSSTTVLIGDPDFRKNEFASDLLKFLIGFRFRAMDIEKIEEKVRGENEAAFRLCEKLGYKKEGILVKHEPGPNGERLDLTLFGLTCEDWQASEEMENQ